MPAKPIVSYEIPLPTLPICQACGEAIAEGEGWLEIVNTNPDLGPVGGWPRSASRELDGHGNYAGERNNTGERNYSFQVWTWKELENKQFTQVNIGFKLLHGRCDPDIGADSYWLDIWKLLDPEEWLRTLRHVAGKKWMSTYDITRMMEIWPLYSKNIGQATESKNEE